MSSPTQFPKIQSQFFPPESFGSLMIPDELSMADVDLTQGTSWDIACRYHEFKSQFSSSRETVKQLRHLSAAAILERAQAVLGSVVHPFDQRTAPLSQVPPEADQVDLDLDETLDHSPLAVASLASGSNDYPLTDDDLWMSYSVPRRQPVVLSVDTSLSMTGEKLALTAVAIAVVLLEFPHDPIGIIAFENEAQVIKRPEERISIQELVERFIDVPAQGYTHLEDGLRVALKLIRNLVGQGLGRPPSTVLLTDGKYTAGKDPVYLAPRFPHLVVIKMGKEKASLQLCRELARKGQGAIREVDELEALPLVMYNVVKDLLRGRSIS